MKIVKNMTHIIDYQATQPISKTGETTFAIPSSPNKAILANLKLRISSRDSRNNRVELIATIGVEGITGTSQVLFRIFRDNIEVLMHK